MVLAMLEQEGGLAPEILEKLGTAPHGVAKRFRQELKKTPTVAYAGQNIYITPRISKLQERAVAEMTRLRDDFIGIDHLLVAAVEEKEGDAPVIFREFGHREGEGVPGAAGDPGHEQGRRPPGRKPVPVPYRNTART